MKRGERFRPPPAKPRDVNHHPKYLVLSLAMDDGTGKFLQSVERRTPRPDQQPEIITFDVHEDVLLVGSGLRRRLKPETFNDTANERGRKLGLFLDTHH